MSIMCIQASLILSGCLQCLALFCLCGRMRNLVLTKKLTDEFCLFFTDMTYVPGQFFPYILGAISGHFPRWPFKKLVGTIS